MARKKQVALRLPAWLLEAVAAETEHLRRKRPGAVIHLATVVRKILARALGQKERGASDHHP